MTDLRGRTFSDLVAGLNAGQHLTVDAVVAFVDGELGVGAHERAAEHLTSCQSCTAEVAAQRQARSVIRSAGYPRVPAGLLAALRDIPLTADLPPTPDGLAVADDGAVVAVADPGRAAIARVRAADRAPIAPLGRSAPQGRSAPLGAGPRWGTGPSILGRRIGRTGAGAVVSGLMLGALMMTMLEDPISGTAVPQFDDPVPAHTPSVIPALAPLPQLGVGASGDTALLHMTNEPGWHVLRVPR
ncbi:MAG TPA: zf-HC2 domain-containing protein [Pseudonocardiaceae bacterium]|nr:zf-HC2 domain-containing protein [Pseudonocardiaceae bacterium]